jgi:hypothetical protein
MGLAFDHRRSVFAGIMLAGFAIGALAQSATTITEPASPLLPQSFGEWKAGAASPSTETPSISLTTANKAALEESGPQRSQVADYIHNGHSIHVEAIQFTDRTGAYSAFTLVQRPDMRTGKELGSVDAVGDGAVLFTVGTSLVLAYPATSADVASLKPLSELMPKASGPKGVAPLLPTFVPSKGLVEGSVRYAIGASTYAAEGGVLPAQSLGWDKSAEAVTAQFVDKRGKETLTLLLYPTPAIAGNFTKAIQNGLASMGPSFANAKTRREGDLVMLASGSFSPDEAQRMIENIHLKQMLSFDKDMPPVFQVEVVKTYSLLTNILVLTGIMGLAALLLGTFLGGGRALYRVMRGKDAATEAEFLSLHLDPQNATPRFGAGENAG